MSIKSRSVERGKAIAESIADGYLDYCCDNHEIPTENDWREYAIATADFERKSRHSNDTLVRIGWPIIRRWLESSDNEEMISIMHPRRSKAA